MTCVPYYRNISTVPMFNPVSSILRVFPDTKRLFPIGDKFVIIRVLAHFTPHYPH